MTLAQEAHALYCAGLHPTLFGHAVGSLDPKLVVEERMEDGTRFALLSFRDGSKLLLTVRDNDEPVLDVLPTKAS